VPAVDKVSGHMGVGPSVWKKLRVHSDGCGAIFDPPRSDGWRRKLPEHFRISELKRQRCFTFGKSTAFELNPCPTEMALHGFEIGTTIYSCGQSIPNGRFWRQLWQRASVRDRALAFDTGVRTAEL
jgi:hypothetical protein